MLGSGSGEIETLLAGAKHLKKTIIVDGIRTVVPGYKVAMCVMTGITMFFTIQFLLMGSEYVPCSPHHTDSNLDYAVKEPWVTL
jgi:hypothetical protein